MSVLPTLEMQKTNFLQSPGAFFSWRAPVIPWLTLVGMDTDLKRLESWLALIAEELYVARLDRETAPRPGQGDDEGPARNAGQSDQRRAAHVDQIQKLRITLNGK